MPRRRQPPLPLGAGALAAVLAFAATQVVAQTATTDPALMRPALDGDPLNPPRFRRPRGQTAGSAQTAQAQSFQYQPGFGAGTTGFDSTNARRKGKAAQKAKAGSAATPTVAATVPAQAATSPAAARLPQNQPRRGAPPVTGAFAQVPTPILTTTTPLITTLLRRRPPPDEDPFAPVGAQLGAFLLRPAIELTGAYDTNPARTTNATPSWYSVIAPELQANSNWARHEMTANLRGSYTTYERLHSLDRPNLDAKVNGRVDITRDTQIDLETRFLIATDNPGSPNIQAGLARLPINTTLGGTAGITQRFNRFEVSAKGLVDRTVYQPSTFTDGSTASNDDRNFNRYSSRLRTSYDLLPGMKPFAEIGADVRVHDLPVDVFGFQRDSEGRYGKAGSTFDFYRTLTGEVAVGYLTRTYKDPSLSPLRGPTFDASLTWLASALTTVKLTAKTTADESTVAGVSGVFTHEVALQVDHAFRRWLIATLKFTHGFDDYVGGTRKDDRYATSALLTYKLNREWQIKAEYRREWLRSNTSGVDYTANIYLLGVRFQR